MVAVIVVVVAAAVVVVVVVVLVLHILFICLVSAKTAHEFKVRFYVVL